MSILRVAVAAISTALPLAVAEAATLRVDPRGGGDHLTIQQAVNAAGPGDMILVAPGTYDEQVVVDKEVRILGVDPSVCRVRYVGSGAAMVFRGQSQSASVVRMTVSSQGGSGVHCQEGATTRVINNVVTGSNGHGVWIERNASPSIINNVIAYNGDSGIYNASATRTSVAIVNNIIVSNGGYGIVGPSSEVARGEMFRFNNVWGNASGAENLLGYSFPGLGDIARSPEFVDITQGDYRLKPV